MLFTAVVGQGHQCARGGQSAGFRAVGDNGEGLGLEEDKVRGLGDNVLWESEGGGPPQGVVQGGGQAGSQSFLDRVPDP